MGRINFDEAVQESVIKMCGGNPGALNCLMAMLRDGAAIDPNDFMGGISNIFDLDHLGIYGTDIYVLFADICDKNLSKMIAVLRAVQLGMFSGEVLAEAASRQDRSGKAIVPVDDLCRQVKERLPRFQLS